MRGGWRARARSAGRQARAVRGPDRGEASRTVPPKPPEGPGGEGRDSCCGDRSERPRFDTLFAEPRHFRGDCRLVRRGILQGWVRPEDADALSERLGEAMRIAEADGRARHRLAIARLVLDIHRAAMGADAADWMSGQAR